MLSIILDIIQSNYFIHADIFENVYVLSRMLSIPMLCISIFYWTHKRNKFTRYNPIEVSVLDSLVVLVLLDIEGPEVVPAEPDSVLEALQTVEQRAVVEALALGGIAVVPHYRLVRLELGVRVLRLHLQDYYHEGAHQESAIHQFVTWVG